MVTVVNAPGPSAWIVRHLNLISPGSPVLDVACGRGRHTVLFLERGHPVAAVDADISRAAHISGRLELVEADLERDSWPFPGRRFGAVVVTNYLWRPLFPALLDAVAPGGLLLYETFAAGQERFGKPSNPAFLLKPGELLEIVRGQLVVRAYEHGEFREPESVMRQRLAAVRE